MLPDDEFEREHPSYGILHIARTNGNSKRLFGSPLAAHYSTIRLSISKGKWIHGLQHDRYFGMNKDFVEIEMSAAQFAEAITSLNMGSGTPCTIRYVGGERVPNPPDYATEAEHVRNNFKETLGKYTERAHEERKRIEKLTSKLSAKAQEEIRIALDVMEQQLASNVPFVVDQFQEATTRVTTAAKAEVEAFVTHAVRAAGLQAIAEWQVAAAVAERQHDEDPPKNDEMTQEDCHRERGRLGARLGWATCSPRCPIRQDGRLLARRCGGDCYQARPSADAESIDAIHKAKSAGHGPQG